MTQLTLSQNTQTLINTAVSSGPGTNNVNYLNAYNAIYSDLKANGGINSGTMNFFAQAGEVNTQQFSSSGPGTYIWAFTQAAVASEGGTASNALMQQASNTIASKVFNNLKSANFVFSDDVSAPINFAPPTIISDDATAGYAGVIEAANPNVPLTYAAWGGTLFATTMLNDPTYASDYHLNLTLGSTDCKAIFAGLDAAAAAELESGSISNMANSLLSLFNLDMGMLDQCGHANWNNLSSSNPSLTVTSAGSGVYDIALNQNVSSGGTYTLSSAYNTTNGDWSTTENDFNSSGQKTDQATLNYGSGGLTTVLQGLNTSGGVTYEQDTTNTASDQTSASISGSGDVSNLSNTTLTLSSGAQAVIDGIDDTIGGSSFTVSLGVGASGDTVNVTTTGTGVNMTGAGGTVGSDTITVQGPLLLMTYYTIGKVSVAESTQTTVTGTDGTLTTDTQGANNPFQNTVNWNAGGSQNQVVNPGNGASLEYLNFTGANATGTDTQNILDLTSGGSQEQLFTGLPSGDIEVVDYFTAPNDAGTLTSTTWNASAGGSVTEWFNPTSALSTEVGAYTAYNDGGSNLYNVLNYSAGGSQLQQLNPAALPSGVTSEDETFSGTGLTGTDTQNALNFSINTSQLQLYTNLPTGDTEIVDNYGGLNLTGALNNTIWDASNNSSTILWYNPTSTISSEGSGYTGLNGTGTNTYNVVNYAAGGSLYEQLTNLQSGVSESMIGYAGAGLTGAEKYTLTDDTNNTSQLDFLAPSSGVANDMEYFGGPNATQGMVSSLVTNTDNSTMVTTNIFGDNYSIIGWTDKFYSTADAYLGQAVFSSSLGLVGGNIPTGGSYSNDVSVAIEGDGINLDGGDGYDDGGDFEVTGSAKTTGANSVNLAPYVTNQAANSPAWNAAQAAQSEISLLTQLQSSGSSAATASSFYEDTKWNSKTVTWSLADMAGASGSPFSSYMGPQYAALAQKAFAAWGAASGITFEQVADSSQSDIRIGWGDFSTSSSGVVGYTSYQYQKGQMQPNVIIRLEDPSQDSLVAGTGSTSTAPAAPGSATYSGTQANLYQVLVHEIGHALGLADNADPNSVMYYQASGSANSTLDSTDIAGMQALYGTGPSTLSFASNPFSEAAISSTVQQMVQAMASFSAQQSGGSSFVPPAELNVPSPLAIPHGTVT